MRRTDSRSDHVNARVVAPAPIHCNTPRRVTRTQKEDKPKEEEQQQHKNRKENSSETCESGAPKLCSNALISESAQFHTHFLLHFGPLLRCHECLAIHDAAIADDDCRAVILTRHGGERIFDGQLQLQHSHLGLHERIGGHDRKVPPAIDADGGTLGNLHGVEAR